MKIIAVVIVTTFVIGPICYYFGHNVGEHHEFLRTAQTMGVNSAHFMNELESKGPEKTIENFSSTYEAIIPGALYAHGQFLEIDESPWKILYLSNDVEASKKSIDKVVSYYRRHELMSFYDKNIKPFENSSDFNSSPTFIKLHKSHDYYVKKAAKQLGL